MRPSLVEQTKLLANALDRASTACITVGIATPIAGYVYNVSNFRALVTLSEVLGAVLIWFLIAATLHLWARRVLKGLDG
ncbi:hypothetical protein [Methylobacterium oxalidis]|uniref:Uncharacterized protein n=1 Tax=Methylobacterium oxalidis TaxID=944322 RepID=A0A512JC63_9HYPH|nr:hypothetical protein [Methylobacterium oxalidis]GEP07556.1 hypothetical protein MOX02_55940 [Methylobacterium oxalidis]GJE35457.1 hypothetical protein LDDCCGHA_5675 [Methylobacterium oxalidis]GLS61729.1 hypothetical protein GCM10007888_01100 [Methylobacterium oxalidis]